MPSGPDGQHDPVNAGRSFADEELALPGRDRKARITGEAGDVVGAQTGAVERLVRPDHAVVGDRDPDAVIVNGDRRHAGAGPDLGAQSDRRFRVRPGQPEGVDDPLIGDEERSDGCLGDVRRVEPQPRGIDELHVDAMSTSELGDGVETSGLLWGPRQHQRAAGERGHAEIVEQRRPALRRPPEQPRLDRARTGVETRVENRAVRLARPLADIGFGLEEDGLDSAKSKLEENGAADDATADHDRLGRLRDVPSIRHHGLDRKWSDV